jgi:hypothetical protein
MKWSGTPTWPFSCENKTSQKYFPNLFWDIKWGLKKLFSDPIFFCRPYYFFNAIDRATLFSPGGCGLLLKWHLLSHQLLKKP